MWRPRKRFLADHYDTFEKKEDADERTLCGHVDLSPRGDGEWQPPYGAAGAVQNKVADATMAEHMSFTAAAGHACGLNFKSAEYLHEHSGFSWEKPFCAIWMLIPGRLSRSRRRRAS